MKMSILINNLAGLHCKVNSKIILPVPMTILECGNDTATLIFYWDKKSFQEASKVIRAKHKELVKALGEELAEDFFQCQLLTSANSLLGT
ncbi:MAG: hypothetical protein LIP09_12270 [Bacteroidales bacterium]|nr:hypothetical protein [Bacteroidales bacterium]